MSAPIDDPVPDSAAPRPRLGDLLLNAGLLTPEQLEESLSSAHTAGKPLGHVLVERGLVPAHSIAMALADQHGGPLKSEFGFATGRGSTPRSPDMPVQAPSAPPVLRLAPLPPEVHLAGPIVAGTSPEASPESVTTTPSAADEEREAETAARVSAEARAHEQLARVEELQAELETAGTRAAEAAAAPLRSQLEVLQTRLDAQAANEESLATMRDELATVVAAEASLRSQLAAEREVRAQDAKTVEAWRAELERVGAQNEEASMATAGLRAQLDELHAEGEALRVQVAAERAANERTATSTDALNAQIEELRSQRAADAAAASAAEASLALALAESADVEALRATIANDRVKSSTAEEALAAVREELATALAAAESVRATLAAEREAHHQATATADALRARITELETAANVPGPSPAAAPLHEDVDHLRAVIELQEQALAAAAARERARDGDARVVADPPRSYSDDAHFLFAPTADGYELLERVGSSPSPGDVIELSGGRRCRVLRVGPAPFPGTPNRCAYLELV